MLGRLSHTHVSPAQSPARSRTLSAPSHWLSRFQQRENARCAGSLWERHKNHFMSWRERWRLSCAVNTQRMGVVVAYRAKRLLDITVIT